ncbi:MAG TPA: Wzz/FepE/Etk N-terminal domain-containing protein, partial [Dehalococcoidia bacterium]|nr:Wzz/FepE/Etk N-terminal domain-containing protein [Dehalococcoidia bacterium]
MGQLRAYWGILFRSWWLVVALGVVGAAAGYGFSVSQAPLYRSSAKLYVMPARPDQGITYYSQNVVR